MTAFIQCKHRSPTLAYLAGQLIRGLSEAYYRNPGTDMAAYVKAYLFVQFNAILDAATVTIGGSDAYSANWLGPPPSAFSPEGSIAALEVSLTS